MSLRCAQRLGFKIDTNPRARSRVMLADERIVETVGQVHISSIELSNYDTFDMSFHILPGLLISLGPIQSFLSRTWSPDVTGSAQQVHDDGILAEIYRRSTVNHAIRKMKNEDQASAERKDEDLRRKSFDRRHERCFYCVPYLSKADLLVARLTVPDQTVATASSSTTQP